MAVTLRLPNPFGGFADEAYVRLWRCDVVGGHASATFLIHQDEQARRDEAPPLHQIQISFALDEGEGAPGLRAQAYAALKDEELRDPNPWADDKKLPKNKRRLPPNPFRAAVDS